MADDKQVPPPPPQYTPGNEGYQQNTGQAPPGYQSQPGYPVQVQPGYPPQYQSGYGYTGYTQQPMPAGAMTTHNVTVVQTGGPTVVAAVFPPDHCFLSWFACLFCCWPLGICAIINSCNARDAINRGDFSSASVYSQMAKKYASWSIFFGFVLIIIIVVSIVAAG